MLALPLKGKHLWRKPQKAVPSLVSLYECIFMFHHLFQHVSYSYPVLLLCAALDAFTDLVKEIALKHTKLSSATNTKQYHTLCNSSPRALFNMKKRNKIQSTEFIIF